MFNWCEGKLSYFTHFIANRNVNISISLKLKLKRMKILYQVRSLCDDLHFHIHTRCSDSQKNNTIFPPYVINCSFKYTFSPHILRWF